jgi:hypothetical protein
MNAPVRHQQVRLDPLEVFELRCWARAYLWSVSQFDLVEAVDELQLAAEHDGLVTKLGQDTVQRMMADAFHGVAR